tara:strand:- start:31 stop:1680 length:1650 start_codon:yes stop_codon:yes gene_type:complete
MDLLPEGAYVKLEDGSEKFFPKGTPISQIEIANKNALIRMEQNKKTENANKKITGGFGDAASVIAGSTLQLAKDYAAPFIDPIGTAKNFYSLGKGIYSLVTGGDSPDEETAQAIGQYYANSYGSMDKILNKLNTDPAAFIADASIVFTGGGSLVKMLGKNNKFIKNAGQKIVNLGTRIDPLRQAVLLPSLGAKAALKNYTGVAGGGVKNLEQAYKTARSGTINQKKALFEDMTLSPDLSSLVTKAQAALTGLKDKKQKDYQKSIKKLKLNTIGINATDLTNKIRASLSSYDRLDTTTLGKADQAVRVEALKLLDEFDNNPKLHNLEGADILKQQLGELQPNVLERGNKSKKLITQAQNIARDAILKDKKVGRRYKSQSQSYENISNLEKEIVNDLSLNANANVKKSMVLKKMQAAFRDDGSYSLNRRKSLLDDIDKDGTLNARLTGAALSNWQPSGVKGGINNAIRSGIAGAGIYGLNPLALPAIALQTAAASPRLAGQTAYSMGRLMDKAQPVMPYAKALTQTLKYGRPVKTGLRIEEEDNYNNRNMM